jgi:hypothetical protein
MHLGIHFQALEGKAVSPAMLAEIGRNYFHAIDTFCGAAQWELTLSLKLRGQPEYPTDPPHNIAPLLCRLPKAIGCVRFGHSVTLPFESFELLPHALHFASEGNDDYRITLTQAGNQPPIATERISRASLLSTLTTLRDDFLAAMREHAPALATTEGMQRWQTHASLPAEIALADYLQWRAPRFGTQNPERLDNPVWDWSIRANLGAEDSDIIFLGLETDESGPAWCFARMGQSRTDLPDGRSVWVAGEYEDDYHPQFCIYNDVVVRGQDGSVQIFGYPEDVFPPTDFHTATLLGNAIILIGSVGQHSDTPPETTQVLRLELDSWRISRIETTGFSPGWISDHTATLTEDGQGILISGGKIQMPDLPERIENLDNWRLDTRSWTWSRLSHKRWTRLMFYRADKRLNHLWKVRQLNSTVPTSNTEIKQRLIDELGYLPSSEALQVLYRPNVANAVLPGEDEFSSTHRIRVGNVTVRYVEEWFTIQLIIEGELSAEVIDALRQDLIGKLSALERTRIHSKTIQPR